MISRFLKLGLISASVLAFAGVVAAQDQSYPIFLTEVMASNGATLADEDGAFEDWFELINFSAAPLNLNGVGVSDDAAEPFKWTFGDVVIGPYEFLVVFASGKDRALHTNFGISASGEDLTLTAPNGTTLDTFFTGAMRRDTSRGRHEDATIEWPYFLEPTPGGLNDTQWYLGYAEQPALSVSSGIVASAFDVTATPGDADDLLFYTLDGSIPTTADAPVIGPIPISSTTVLRVQAIRDGFIPSRPATRVYLFGEVGGLPILTVATDPDLLFDPETGAYMPGPNPTFPNYHQDIEVPIHFTMFETDGTTVVDQDAGLELHGGYGRVLPKKGLKIKARARLGADDIGYQLFPEKDLDSFRTILLRASSADQYETLFRDALQQSLVDVTSLDYQSYRPALLYINTEFWGIYNIREMATWDYIHDNYGLEENEIDLIENSRAYEVRAGSWDNFQALWEFIALNDLSSPANYEQLKTMMDIDFFLDYFAVEIFVGNIDWPDTNIRWWRPRAEDGKWRALLYDLDAGFRLTSLFHDTLAYATNDQPLAPDVPVELSNNSPESTFIFRSLLSNDEFRADFISRMTDVMNIVYHPSRVIQRVDQFQLAIWNQMPAEIERWWTPTGLPITIETWFEEVHELRLFAVWRPLMMELFMAQKFGLTARKNVTVEVSPSGSGDVRVNSQAPMAYPYQGAYFPEVPLALTALPGAGFAFDSWTGAVSGVDASVSIDLTGDIVVTANFVETAIPAPPTIVLNEINYNSADAFDPGDWVELHNFGVMPVDVSGWAFKDQSDIDDAVAGFVIPAGTLIAPGGYLVLCNDPNVFTTLFPGVACVSGFDYGLGGGGDFVALYDSEAVEIDALQYDDVAPWPTEPDGNGATLELIDPLWDNALAESWSASSGNGSPGSANGALAAFQVAFNEINYNSADELDPGDWVELVNYGSRPIDLSGWVFKDQGNLDDAEPGFVLPQGTAIAPGGFVVLCNDEAVFASLFPGTTCISGFDYGLSGSGDFIALFDDGDNERDSLTYDDQAPWPTEPDGNGPTLELVDPTTDNALPSSWQASDGHGTPGMPNTAPVP